MATRNRKAYKYFADAGRRCHFFRNNGPFNLMSAVAWCVISIVVRVGLAPRLDSEYPLPPLPPGIDPAIFALGNLKARLLAADFSLGFRRSGGRPDVFVPASFWRVRISSVSAPCCQAIDSQAGYPLHSANLGVDEPYRISSQGHPAGEKDQMGRRSLLTDELRKSADRMRRLREVFAVSQGQFAKRFGFSRNQWNNFESGMPVGHQAGVRLVKAIPGLTLDWIYFGNPAGLTVQMAEFLGELRARDGGASKFHLPPIQHQTARTLDSLTEGTCNEKPCAVQDNTDDDDGA